MYIEVEISSAMSSSVHEWLGSCWRLETRDWLLMLSLLVPFACEEYPSIAALGLIACRSVVLLVAACCILCCTCLFLPNELTRLHRKPCPVALSCCPKHWLNINQCDALLPIIVVALVSPFTLLPQGKHDKSRLAICKHSCYCPGFCVPQTILSWLEALLSALRCKKARALCFCSPALA